MSADTQIIDDPIDPLIAWEVVTLDDRVIEERTEKRR